MISVAMIHIRIQDTPMIGSTGKYNHIRRKHFHIIIVLINLSLKSWDTLCGRGSSCS